MAIVGKIQILNKCIKKSDRREIFFFVSNLPYQTIFFNIKALENCTFLKQVQVNDKARKITYDCLIFVARDSCHCLPTTTCQNSYSDLREELGKFRVSQAPSCSTKLSKTQLERYWILLDINKVSAKNARPKWKQ